MIGLGLRFHRWALLAVGAGTGVIAALQAAGSPSQIVLYPDTPHGFHADYRPSYRKEQAQDGWKRLQEWLKKYGAA